MFDIVYVLSISVMVVVYVSAICDKLENGEKLDAKQKVLTALFVLAATALIAM